MEVFSFIMKALLRSSEATYAGQFLARDSLKIERVRGIGPLSAGWKPAVMPLYDTRLCDAQYTICFVYETLALPSIAVWENVSLLLSRA